MVEAQVGLLLKAASVLSQNKNSDINKIFESYYLLRCKQVTKGFGLPKKQFSENVRCSRCCIELKDEGVKLKPKKLNKRQRKRIRCRKKKELKSKVHSLHYNELVKTCSFCGKSRNKILRKPQNTSIEDQNRMPSKPIEDVKVKEQKKLKMKVKPKNDPVQSNVYCKSKVAFSMDDKKNILTSALKKPDKIIKNNKKKKDKLAGLCKMAVDAAIKLKQEKENKKSVNAEINLKQEKENKKLNLFLKPSS